MSKRLSRILAVLIGLIGCFVYSSDVQAFFLMRLIKSPRIQIPMPDFLNEAVSLGNSVGALAETAMKTKNTTENSINNIRSALNSVFNFDLTAKIDGAVNPGQLEIISCKVGDINIDLETEDENGDIDYDAVQNSISDAMQILFFQYPDNTTENINAYKAKKKAFYNDTIVEIYTASRQLQLDMEDRVKPTLEEAYKAVREGGNGVPAPDGNSESIYAEAKMMEALDNLLEVMEKAVALKVQLRAVQAINQIEPRSYYSEEGEEQQQSAIDTGRRYAAAVSNVETLGFAQVGLGITSRTTVSSLAEVESKTVLGDNEAQEQVNKVIDLAEAPESEIFHPYDLEQEKMAELDKIEPLMDTVNTAVGAHNMIRELDSYKQAGESYYQAVEEHKKALEALKEADSCAKQYVGRHFASPDIVWAGRVLGDNVGAHDLRGGISGWAVEAYETAKAAQTSNVSTGNVMSVNIDTEDGSFSDITDSTANQQRLEEIQPISSTSAQEEQAAEESRESVLLPWQVGSEASKMLAADAASWGTVTSRFPIWNDVKSFYNQYLTKKYANIRSYLKMFTAGDIKALLVAGASGQQQSASGTLLQKEYVEIDASSTAEQEKLRSESEAESKQYQSKAEQELAALQSRRDAAAARLDDATQKYKEISDEISDARQQSKDDAYDSLEEDVSHIDSFSDYEVPDIEASLRSSAHYASVFTVAGAFLDTVEELESNVNERTEENKKTTGIETLESQLKQQEQVVSNLQKQVDDLDEQIKQKKLEIQEQSSSIRAKLMEKLAAARSASEAAKQAASEKFAAAADANINKIATAVVERAMAAFAAEHPDPEDTAVYDGPTVSFLMAGLDNAINKALNDLYAKVDAAVDAAQSRLTAMGDNLYDPAYHQEVVGIHQQMIDEIKALALTVSYEPLGLAGSFYLYQQLIPADTSAETEDYFAGSPAKERDLKAPKSVFESKLPPLRETVHFDETDFQNVKPYDPSRKESGIIPYEDFLNYGGYIPEVWKYMLKDNAFVEQQIDLKTALNTGCTATAFFRGDIFPCKVKDSSLIIDIDGEGNFYRRKTSETSLPLCTSLEMRNGSVYDIAQDVSIKFSLLTKEESENCSYSELGLLMDADENNNIFFKQYAYDAFMALVKAEEEAEENQDPGEDERRRLAAYGNAPLSVDQIGDFLEYVESEQIQRQKMEELKSSYEDLLTDLKELLAKFGFEASDTFDIAKEEDYQLAYSKLKSLKNSKISEALTLKEDIETGNNDVVEERVDQISRIIAALQKDKDEDVTINNVVADNNNLDEDIKTSKVSKEAVSRYENELNEVSEELDKPAVPYCARY